MRREQALVNSGVKVPPGECSLHSEPRERLYVAAEAVGGCVEDGVRHFRIVKPIAEFGE